MRFTSPALFLLLLPLVASAAERPPNILFLLADDLGYGDVGFNGRADWPTPHLDGLAREGTVFTRWYAPGVVCAPSRAAILTGLYGIHNGVVANNDDLPADRTTIAKALKAKGYATGLFGKWHAGRARPGAARSHPLDYGFDEFMGFTDARAAWEHFPKTLFFGRESKPVQGNADALFADQGIDFLRRHKDGPFFLELAFITPHLRIEVEPEYLAPFRGKFPEKDPAKPSRALILRYTAGVWQVDKQATTEIDAQNQTAASVAYAAPGDGWIATYSEGGGGAPVGLFVGLYHFDGTS